MSSLLGGFAGGASASGVEAGAGAGSAVAAGAPGSRRQSFQASPLSYVEVGASEAFDLLKFPPNGAEVFFEERSVTAAGGYGAAASALLTWGAHRAAGFAVTETLAETGGAYGALAGDADTETVYGANGEPLLSAGDTAEVHFDADTTRALLVVRAEYSADEAVLVLGMTDSAGPVGEHRYRVWRDDSGATHAEVRGFWHEGERGRRGVKQHTAWAVEVLQAAAQGAVAKTEPAAEPKERGAGA